MFFCFFSKFHFMRKKSPAGLPKDSCQRNYMSLKRLSQYFHTLPKAVSHEAGSARRLPPTGRTPLALSPDAFARGWLFYLFLFNLFKIMPLCTKLHIGDPSPSLCKRNLGTAPYNKVYFCSGWRFWLPPLFWCLFELKVASIASLKKCAAQQNTGAI